MLGTSEWHKCKKRPLVVDFRQVQGESEVITTPEGSQVEVFHDTHFVMRDEAGLYPILQSVFENTYDVLEDKCVGCDYNIGGFCLCENLMAATCIPTYSGKNVLEQMRASVGKKTLLEQVNEFCKDGCRFATDECRKSKQCSLRQFLLWTLGC